MNDMKNTSQKLLKRAYECKHLDLHDLLEEIEFEIQNREFADENLLRAKLIVTSKLVSYYD